MKTKSMVAVLLLCLASAVMSVAQDAQLGSWELNEAKSKFSPGSPKTTSSKYEAAGDMIKVTLDGVGFDGKPSHTEWTGKYDGKDYPTTGDPNQTSRSYTKIDAHRMKIAVKHGDAVILSGTITVAANGKSRTVEATGGMADKKFSYTAVYDKQ